MPKVQEAPAPAEPKTTRSKVTPAGTIGPSTLTGHCEIADRVAAGIVTSNKTADELHRTCKGAITNGVGTTWLCRCSCHDGRLYCHRCGFDHTENPEGFRPDRRQCWDATDCADKIRADFEHLKKTDPFLVQIGEIRKEVDAARAEENAIKAAKRREEAERARAAGETSETPEEATKPRSGRTKGQPQRCHEGCGGMTKGGMFMMGHDMRLKGQLFKVAREGGNGAVTATVELLARNWSLAGIDQAVLSVAKHEYAELGETEAIRQAVERRYE